MLASLKSLPLRKFADFYPERTKSGSLLYCTGKCREPILVIRAVLRACSIGAWAGVGVKWRLGCPHPILARLVHMLIICFWPSFLLMSVLRGNESWIRSLGPCHLCGRPVLISGLLALPWANPGFVGSWSIQPCWKGSLCVSAFQLKSK